MLIVTRTGHIFILAAALALAVGVGYRLSEANVPQAGPHDPGVLRVRAIFLEDANGNERGFLGSAGDQAVGLVLKDANGVNRIKLQVTDGPDGEPSTALIALTDPNGKVRLVAVQDGSSTGLTISDPSDESPISLLYNDKADKAVLVMNGKSSRPSRG